MAPFKFIGGAYQSQSVNADAQKCQNFYVEKNESGAGKSEFQLLCTPGTKTFAKLYEDFPGLSVAALVLDLGEGGGPFTLTDGSYYAALALVRDADGVAVKRSRVFGPFPVKVTHAPPPSALITASTFRADVPEVAPAGFTWFIYFGTARTNLNQAIAFGVGVAELTITANGAAATLPDAFLDNAVFSEIEKDGRCFVTSRTGFWELFADGYAQWIAQIFNDFGPKVLAASQIQILLSSGGHCYLFTLATNLFQEILTDGTTALQAPVVSVGFSDGFFIALLKTGEFQISGIEDGATWDPNDIDKVSVFPDSPTAMIVDHRELIVAGPKQGQVYYDSGNPLFPFDVVPGGFTENGVGAPASMVKADNTVFWIDADERGGGIARRAQGYNPLRISTHAIEEHWRKFASFQDARGWSYQEAGHTFVVWYFPSADETWAYDVATGLWAERTGRALQCHYFAFGKHLVGDAKSGTIYEMSIDLGTHDGATIFRDRTSPHISKENVRIAHNEFRLDMETGLGPQPPLRDGAGEPRNPQIYLQWSDDGGHKFSQPHARDCGAAGEFKKRVRWLRLGMPRDRVYKLTYSDPTPCRIIEAYLNPE